MADDTPRPSGWRDDARDWCQGRRWEWRALVMAVLTYLAVRGLTAPEEWNWFGGITLGVHEAGHILFSPFGQFLEAAGGSIAQVAAPVIVAVIFQRKQRDYFGVAVAGTWLAYSLGSLAAYIGDARAQELPLIGFTDQPEHDWHYLLGQLGWLKYDSAFAGLTRLAAVLVLLQSVGLAVWLFAEMHRARRAGARAAAD
jgi:hypothetical protein